MQAFIVEAANHPGELARVADTIATRGVNTEAFCLTYGNKGAAAFLSYDEKGVRTALDADGFTYREIPLVTISRSNSSMFTPASPRRWAAHATWPGLSSEKAFAGAMSS